MARARPLVPNGTSKPKTTICCIGVPRGGSPEGTAGRGNRHGHRSVQAAEPPALRDRQPVAPGGLLQAAPTPARPAPGCGPGRGHDCASGRCHALRGPDNHPREPEREVRGLRTVYPFAVDVGISIGVFMLALAAISFAASVLTGKGISWHRGDIWVIVASAVWAFGYFAHSWAASGRTAGMALVGVRVVADDGADASGRQAVVRTLALPLSFLLLGLGFAGHPAG